MTTDDTGPTRRTTRAFEDMVLEHSNDAALLIHPEDGVVYASPATSRVLGLDPAALVGMMAAEWVHPGDVDAALELRRHSTLHGHGGPIELRGRHGDGSFHWFEAEWWHVVHHYTVLHLRDIERERSLRLLRDSAAARLEALLRQSREMFVILRSDLTGFTYVSASVERVLGWSIQTDRQPAWRSRVHHDDLESLHQLLESARAEPGRTVHGRLKLAARNGQWRKLDVRVTDLTADPGIEGIVVNAWLDEPLDV